MQAVTFLLRRRVFRQIGTSSETPSRWAGKAHNSINVEATKTRESQLEIAITERGL